MAYEAVFEVGNCKLHGGADIRTWRRGWRCLNNGLVDKQVSASSSKGTERMRLTGARLSLECDLDLVRE